MMEHICLQFFHSSLFKKISPFFHHSVGWLNKELSALIVGKVFLISELGGLSCYDQSPFQCSLH